MARHPSALSWCRRLACLEGPPASRLHHDKAALAQLVEYLLQAFTSGVGLGVGPRRDVLLTEAVRCHVVQTAVLVQLPAAVVRHALLAELRKNPLARLARLAE